MQLLLRLIALHRFQKKLGFGIINAAATGYKLIQWTLGQVSSTKVISGSIASALSWARRSRQEPLKRRRLAATLKQRLDGVVRGMLNNRSKAYVEAMNGSLQQAKRAARGFKNCD